MFSQFSTTLNRTVNKGISTDVWKLACTAMPKGNVYLANIKNNLVLCNTWKENETMLTHHTYNLKNPKMPSIGCTFSTSSTCNLTDIAIGNDYSRLYGIVATHELDALYDSYVICVDVVNRQSTELEAFTILPMWNITEFFDDTDLTKIDDIQQMLVTSGIGTHSYTFKAFYEYATIVSYEGYIYLSIPVFFLPACCQLDVLYVISEYSHAIEGVGVVGELTFNVNHNFIRPIKNNMLVIDNILVFRNKRISFMDKNKYHAATRSVINNTAVKYPRQQYLNLFSDDNVTHYFKQPYTTSYISIPELHTQIVGSSVRTPVIINTVEAFNAHVIGNYLYDSISIDHTWQKMYTSYKNIINEYTLDFLIVELYFGNRWVRMESIVFPYCADTDTDVQIKIKNGAMYTKLVNIKFTLTSTAYSLPVNEIPLLNPQEELVLTLTFSNPTDTIIDDILMYSYATYI